MRELREHSVAAFRRAAAITWITLPCLRGLYDGAPLGLVRFDSHSDTLDEFYGRKVTHATTIRRAHEEGLIDPRRSVQSEAPAARSGTATTSPTRWTVGCA